MRENRLSAADAFGGGGSGSGMSCFPAGTQILLADKSTKAIEQVSIGDIVMGFDGSISVPVRVEALESPLRDHLCALCFADGSSVRLTQEHPLYARTGWKSLSPQSTAEENDSLLVGKLEIGDEILTAAGVYRRLVDIVFIPGQVQTYNIKKLSPHDNFFANGFLAHSKATADLTLAGIANHSLLFSGQAVASASDLREVAPL